MPFVELLLNSRSSLSICCTGCRPFLSEGPFSRFVCPYEVDVAHTTAKRVFEVGTGMRQLHLRFRDFLDF